MTIIATTRRMRRIRRRSQNASVCFVVYGIFLFMADDASLIYVTVYCLSMERHTEGESVY